MKILLVANTSAGSSEGETLTQVTDVLRSGAEVTFEQTESPEDLEALLPDLGGRDLVVAGGDGSLHAVVNALHRLDLVGSTRLGLVPLGTGNDFARGVGLPLDPEQAAQVVLAGRTGSIDLLLDDTGQVVVNNVHLGVGAQASRSAERWKPRLGRFGYAVGALEASLRPRIIDATVTVDGVRLEPPGNIVQVAIGNGSRVGGGTELIPGADPESRSLVVVVSRNRGLWKRLSYVARLRAGSHHLMREVSRVTGQRVEVSGEAFELTTDGEVSGPHTSRSWQVHPAALEMFLP